MEPPERSERGRVKKPKTQPAPPVSALGDDLLGEILRRLPDMASLASAALACKSWGRVASDPAIFRRFHALRRPPLVGFILTDRGDMPVPYYSPDLCFVKASSRNPKLAAAAADGDFFFEDLPEIDDDDGEYYEDEWRLRGCDGGLLLLSRGRDSVDLAVYDPLARTAIFFHPPRTWRLSSHVARYAIVADEVDASFQVIGIQHWTDESSAVFSSRTGKWVIISSDVVRYKLPRIYSDGMAAGRFAYWRSNAKNYRYNKQCKETTLVLDMTTMVWSVITAPFLVGESYCIADMAEHGGMCIVSSKEQLVQFWVRDNTGGWVVKKEVSLLNEFGYLKKLRRDEWMKRVRILAMKAGYVYMEFWSIRKSNSYLLVLNLNTMKLQMFRNTSSNPYRGAAFPFFLRISPLPALNDDKKLQGA